MLITREKLDIYRKAKGDELVYRSKKRQRIHVTEAEWALIETFILFAKLIDNGLSQEAFRLALEYKLSQYCEDEYTIKWLKQMAVYGFKIKGPKQQLITESN
ncbi:MAG: hypothetical protein EAY81_11015 [Bacteroidetes bacterium]|nr:MAG: hypothetical protein EAY81_11015 [Bacteroidota bacterium]